MKKVIVYFGEMGCGKSYVADRTSSEYGYDFLEGDSFVTPAMLERVKKFQPIPQHVLEEYMDVLFDGIAAAVDQLGDGGVLLVSQALYRNADRDDLKVFLESQGHEVVFMWVKTTWQQNIENLLTRKDGWKWVWYWLINKPFFQKPSHPYVLIENNR